MGQGHAREAAALQRLHDERGLDVVRLNPGLCTAREPAQDCLHRPRRAWVGCAASELAGTGGGCAHVEDLGRAYAVALTTAVSGSYYAVADDEPIRLRDLTDVITDAMQIK
jgi:hypothetical protein